MFLAMQVAACSQVMQEKKAREKNNQVKMRSWEKKKRTNVTWLTVILWSGGRHAVYNPCTWWCILLDLCGKDKYLRIFHLHSLDDVDDDDDDERASHHQLSTWAPWDVKWAGLREGEKEKRKRMAIAVDARCNWFLIVSSVLVWCNYLLVQEEERDTQKGLCESFHARIAVVGTGQDVSHIITFTRQLCYWNWFLWFVVFFLLLLFQAPHYTGPTGDRRSHCNDRPGSSGGLRANFWHFINCLTVRVGMGQVNVALSSSFNWRLLMHPIQSLHLLSLALSPSPSPSPSLRVSSLSAYSRQRCLLFSLFSSLRSCAVCCVCVSSSSCTRATAVSLAWSSVMSKWPRMPCFSARCKCTSLVYSAIRV